MSTLNPVSEVVIYHKPRIAAHVSDVLMQSLFSFRINGEQVCARANADCLRSDLLITVSESVI